VSNFGRGCQPRFKAQPRQATVTLGSAGGVEVIDDQPATRYAASSVPIGVRQAEGHAPSYQLGRRRPPRAADPQPSIWSDRRGPPDALRTREARPDERSGVSSCVLYELADDEICGGEVEDELEGLFEPHAIATLRTVHGELLSLGGCGAASRRGAGSCRHSTVTGGSGQGAAQLLPQGRAAPLTGGEAVRPSRAPAIGKR